jgi:hypothetical protein
LAYKSEILERDIRASIKNIKIILWKTFLKNAASQSEDIKYFFDKKQKINEILKQY